MACYAFPSVARIGDIRKIVRGAAEPVDNKGLVIKVLACMDAMDQILEVYRTLRKAIRCSRGVSWSSALVRGIGIVANHAFLDAVHPVCTV